MPQVMLDEKHCVFSAQIVVPLLLSPNQTWPWDRKTPVASQYVRVYPDKALFFPPLYERLQTLLSVAQRSPPLELPLW